MNGKTVLFIVASMALFSLAATYRFYDSAHAIGTLGKGGKARHAALLDRDRQSYILIATAGVIPPYHGNARVELEGDPALKASFHNSGPAVELGFHRHPEFRDNTYFDLRPRDRIALWVMIRRDKGAGSVEEKGTAVTFYDVATKEQLLRIPIRFTGGTGGGNNVH